MLDKIGIQPHKLPTEPEDVSTFSKAESMQESIFFKMIQQHKNDPDSYHAWTVPRGLDLAYDTRAEGTRKREPVKRLAPSPPRARRARITLPSRDCEFTISQPHPEDVEMLPSPTMWGMQLYHHLPHSSMLSLSTCSAPMCVYFPLFNL